jgi:hypothetical protein
MTLGMPVESDAIVVHEVIYLNKRSETTMSDSMLSATGGGYWGGGILNDSVQQVSQRYQIIHGCYNAGSHYGFEVNRSVSKQNCGIWSRMRKCQSYKVAGYRHIEESITKHFWHIVRIYHDWWFRFVSHR